MREWYGAGIAETFRDAEHDDVILKYGTIVEDLRAMIERQGGVTSVGDVLTLHSSPDQITAMVSVDFDDAISAHEVETIVHRIEQEAAARWPMVRRMFIRPQSGAGSFAPGAAWTNHR